MALQYGEGPVDLLQQDDARQFMGQRHGPERQDVLCGIAGLGAKAVGSADSEDQGEGIAVLVIAEKLCELGR